MVTGGSSPSFRSVRPLSVDRCQPAPMSCGGVSSKLRKSLVPPSTTWGLEWHTATDSSSWGSPLASRLNTSPKTPGPAARGGAGNRCVTAASASALRSCGRSTAGARPGFASQYRSMTEGEM